MSVSFQCQLCEISFEFLCADPLFLCYGRSGKYEDALGHFETVLGLKPEAREEAVASYNVACCYAKMNQVTYIILYTLTFSDKY